MAVEADLHAITGKGELIAEELFRLKAGLLRGQGLDTNAELIKEAVQVGLQDRRIIDVFYLCDELLGLLWATGVELKESITALFHLMPERLVGFPGFFDGGGVECFQSIGKLLLEFPGAAGWVGECIQAVMEPAEALRFGPTRRVGDVDVNIACLTDAIQSADALLECFGILGQIDEDEVLGKLEVTALATNFGCDQHAGTIGFGKPSGLSVALYDGHGFMKVCCIDLDEQAELLCDGVDLVPCSADDQHFGFGVAAQEGGEPLCLWLQWWCVGFRCERHEVWKSFWKDTDCGSGIPEEDASGAVAVQQVGQLIGGMAIDELIGLSRNVGIRLMLTLELFEAVVAMWIE